MMTTDTEQQIAQQIAEQKIADKLREMNGLRTPIEQLTYDVRRLEELVVVVLTRISVLEAEINARKAAYTINTRKAAYTISEERDEVGVPVRAPDPVAARFKRARIARGKTQVQGAKALRCSCPYLSQMETGAAPVSAVMVEKMGKLISKWGAA
jgi:hypothetical protein